MIFDLRSREHPRVYFLILVDSLMCLPLLWVYSLPSTTLYKAGTVAIISILKYMESFYFSIYPSNMKDNF